MADADSERKEGIRERELVWEDAELQREQVRGVFALGVIASIIAYLTYRNNVKIPTTNVAVTSLFTFLDLGSFILLSMWGIYVVMIAVSMTFFSSSRPFAIILRGFKSLGRFCFYLGSFSTLVFGLYYVPLFYYQTFQTENLPNQIVFIIVIVGSLSALLILRFRRRLSLKKTLQKDR